MASQFLRERAARAKKKIDLELGATSYGGSKFDFTVEHPGKQAQAAPTTPIAPLEKKPVWNGAQGGAERPITTQALAPRGKETRLYNAITGAGKSYGAGVVNTGGVAVKAVQLVNTQAGQERLKIKAAEDNIADYQKKLQNKALTAEEKSRYQTLIAVNRRNIFAAQSLQNAGNAPTERLSQSLYRKADELRGGAQTDIGEAKAGLGKLGSLAVDVGIAGAQMAGDATLAAATGGTALVPMAIRSFGSGAQEARQAGGDFSDQILYGAGSAATEVLTEKMFNVAAPFKRMFGEGFVDKAIKNAVAKLPVQLGQTAVGKVLLSAGSEAVEEFVSDLITPVLRQATFDRNAEFDLDGALYDALVGGVLGLAGGGVGAVLDRGKQKSAPGTGTPLADEVWNETGHSRQAVASATGAEKATYDALEASKIRHEGETFRNVVAGFDSTISDFFHKWERGRKSHQGEKLEKLYIAKMPETIRKQVGEIVGYPITERDFIFTNDDVKHVYDQHGNPETEIKHGNVPLGDWAFDALPDILTNPDSIIAGHDGHGKNAGKTGVRFEKELSNGRVVCIQFDNAGRKTMSIATIYAKKSTASMVSASKEADTRTFETTEPVLFEESIAPSTPNSKGESDGIGAADAGFDPYSAAMNEYGTIDEGENPARPIDTPKRMEPDTASALDRLGVKISGDLGNYRGADFVRSDNQGEKSVKDAVKKAEIRLEPTKAEKAFASGIAEGLFTSAEIPASMERDAVEELAGYYIAERSYQRPSGVKERGRELRGKVDSLAADYFEDTEKYKPISMLLMNERTPERVMRSIFGDRQGEKINDAYIYPIQKNEAEKLRFTQRMLDAVRTFSDSTGEKSHLSKQERIIVQQMVEDKFVGETVASMETGGMIRAAAETIKIGKDAADAYREFGLSEKEQGLAQQLSRWMVNQELLESGELDAVKIENAVKKYSEQFDLFYEAINDFLVAHGYDTIGFIKGYAPHMQGVDTQNKLVSALKALGVNTDAASLPTSISGLTAEYKPGKRWNPYFQSRVGDKTDYDIAKAYESYVGYMGDILYHTDDIARLRGVSRYLRKTYGSEEITATIEKAESLRNAKLETQVQALKNAGKTTDGTTLSYEDARKQIDAYIDELYDNVQHLSKYGELVKYIDNFANLLAGKQSMADRGMEYMTGRTSLNAGNKLVSAFGRAQVAGNLSSVLNQSAQLSQILAELDGRSLAGAIKDLANATGGRPWAIKRSALFQQSDLLAGKRGVDYLTAGDSKLDQFVTAIFKPADMMDSLVSAIAVQGKYHQLLEQGTPATEALMEADRFATNIMGSRLKGSRPLAFESKSLISQMLHMFQLEALNGWEHITQDMPLQYRKIAEEHGNRAGARALATMATKGIVSAFLLNRVAEAAYGGTPAPFDLLGYIANFIASGLGMSANDWLKQLINSGWKELFGEELFDEEDEEKKPFDAGAATEDLLYDVSNDIPFLRNVTGLLGLGDQTMPLANMAGSVEAVGTAAKNAGIFSGEMGNALLSLGGQTLPGGRQLQKTAQGLQTMTSGGRIYGYGDKQRLQYPVKSSAVNWGQALLFGNTGLSETRDFYASGESGLTTRQTKIWQGMVKDGASSQTVYNAIQRVRAGADTAGKLRALDQAKLTDTEKLKIYTGIIATDESKRPDDFRRLMKNGMTWQQVSDAYAMYLKLNGTDGLSATEKATQFAKWADMSNLQPEHRAAVKAELGFYSQARADAGRYTELTEAGLNPSKAEKLTAALGTLEPKRGETTVSDVQKYRMVVEYGMSETDQMAALESLMEDTAYEKLEDAYHAGISPATFVQFKERTEDFAADHDTNGKTISGSKKRKVLAEIDAMPLSGNQKTALYYAAGYKASTLDDAPWHGKLEPVGSEYLLPAGGGKLMKIK